MKYTSLRFLRVLYPIFKIVLSLILTLFFVTSLLWHIWILSLCCFLLITILWIKPPRAIFVLLLLLFASTPYSFNKISSRMDYLGEIIRETGPTALNTKEKVGIYLGNISMGIVGFAIFAPEVSIETLLLMDPRGKDRVFNSSFAMKSPHIRGLIDDYTSKVKAGKAPLTSKRIPLIWPGKNTYSMLDYRVALAVAGGGLFLNYKPTDEGYDIDCRITIDVKYSENYQLEIINSDYVRLYIDEAIFSAMQDIGWFHPYYAHYHWSMSAL